MLKQGLVSMQDKHTWHKDREVSESPAGLELDLGQQNLVFLYVKLVVQFGDERVHLFDVFFTRLSGYVTFFVSSFPIAPCFALVNNILQLRVDAFKLVKILQRPEPRKVKGIGVFRLYISLTAYAAVITNAALLGLTSSSMGQVFDAFGVRVGAHLLEPWR